MRNMMPKTVALLASSALRQQQALPKQTAQNGPITLLSVPQVRAAPTSFMAQAGLTLLLMSWMFQGAVKSPAARLKTLRSYTVAIWPLV